MQLGGLKCSSFQERSVARAADVGLVEKPFIMVQLESDEQRLRFQVKNKKGKEEQVFKDPSSGIGLKNVKRRLELLYPNKHTLEIKEDELNFSVDLTLELK